nr:unnamed protein product [Digitaria exilis]
MLELPPMYTSGYCSSWDARFRRPFVTVAGKSRSMVLAPTVVIHGERLVRLMGSGPAFPPEQATNTPICMAPNDAMARLSR